VERFFGIGGAVITIGVMSKTTTHEEAYKQAMEEIHEEEIKEIKEIAKIILQKQQDYTEQKHDAEDALRLLKLDLEDLRKGKIEKIRERHVKSKKAYEYSPIDLSKVSPPANGDTWVMSHWDMNSWNDATSGTYTVTTSNGTLREFYL